LKPYPDPINIDQQQLGLKPVNGFSNTGLERLSETLKGYVDRGEIAGLVALVARDDHLHVDAFGVQDLSSGPPMVRDSLFRIASVTKPMTAAVAMMLVEDGRIGLDDRIDRWLPEITSQRVLRTIEADLDDTVPLRRPITLRDLLTFRLGTGMVMAPPGRYPIQNALAEAGFAPGPPRPQQVAAPDIWIERFASVPLIHQPGEQWMYHVGSDLLGILIARVAGAPFEQIMAERLFTPLNMTDTGFYVPPEKVDRLATAYARADGGGLTVYDRGRDGDYTKAPAFASGGGGLVSTADDVLAFSRLLLAGGRHGEQRLLTEASVTQMVTDQLTPEQKAASTALDLFLGGHGWGFGMTVLTSDDDAGLSAGSYGWDGGFGPSYRTDPAFGLTTVLLTQRLMSGPNDVAINAEFRTLARQAFQE
jgi:CubicO group peptidase (beta-lactamase class C family)